MTSPTPLRRYLSVQFGVVAAVPVVIIAILVWQFLLPQMRANSSLQHQGLARAVAGQISAHLLGGQRQLATLGPFLSTDAIHDGQVLTALLDAQCGNGELFETIYIASKKDAVIEFVGLSKPRRSKREDLLGMDLSGRHFMNLAEDLKKPVWSETFLSTASSRLAVALAIPLPNRFIIGEITLDKLSEFISHMPVEAGLLTMVIDRQGRIVADSQRLRWGQQLNMTELPTIVSHGDAQFASSRFQLDGQSFLGTTVDVKQLGWKVLVAQPLKSAFRPLRSAFVLIGLGLAVALAVAVTLAWFQADKLSQLFRAYSDKAQAIARGEYALQWPPSKTREFNELGRNLEQMARMINQREEELEASEHRYRTLFNDAPMMYVITDNLEQEPFIKDVNNMFLDQLGYRREEVLGTPLASYYSEYSKQELKEGGGYQRALDGMFVTSERDLMTRENQVVHTLLHSLPEVDADGKVIGTRAMFIDITDRKRAVEELQRLRNYLSNIINSMPSVLVGVDAEGRVSQWNRQAEQVTGMSLEEARSQPLAKVFPQLTGQMNHIRTAIRDRRVIRDPKIQFKNGGEIRYEDVTIFPLVANGVEGAVIRVDDVTERVRLEEMMIQSEKMLSVGGLAAGMAHEINNPLAGILQNTAVLENRLLGDLPGNRQAAEEAGVTLMGIRRYLELRKLPDMLDNIRNSGNRAAVIVKNMLSFARKSDQVVSSQDIGALLDQTVELIKTDYDMKKHYDFKQMQIVRQYDDHVTAVPCEGSKLQQVFLNILKNGAEAMAESSQAANRSRFILRVQNDADWVRVEIEDNGPGMDEKTRRSIFEPFFTTKPPGRGTGLGLSVSYFIVTEDHGGEMSVFDVDEGGTRFVIRLPREGKKGK